MPVITKPTLVDEIRQGLTHPAQKRLPTSYLYDDAGSALFEAITQLPEYGLTRADERLLGLHAREIARRTGVTRVVDLGSGNGVKARLLLSAFGDRTVYSPVDISSAALETCVSLLPEWVVEPIEADFLSGLAIASSARGSSPLLITFLGSNIGNFERREIPAFLEGIRRPLRAGDFFLLGIDLVKPADRLIPAYDDAAGVTATFNRNLLHRLNREFAADFNVDEFKHEALWNPSERRIEMHLRALSDQRATLRDLGLTCLVRSGESILTEFSHKFNTAEMEDLARSAGFHPVAVWEDEEWPFAEMLLAV